MNGEIEMIINATAFALLDATGAWTLTGVPQSDECCIRQITYSSSNASKGIYLIESNMTGSLQYVGSASNIAGFTSNPNTRIHLRHAPPQQITFQLRHPAPFPQVATDATGDWVAINMDFIKYRK